MRLVSTPTSRASPTGFPPPARAAPAGSGCRAHPKEERRERQQLALGKNEQVDDCEDRHAREGDGGEEGGSLRLEARRLEDAHDLRPHEQPEVLASKDASQHGGDLRAAHVRVAELGADVIVVDPQSEDSFQVLGNDIGHLNSSWQMDINGVPRYDETEFMNEYQIYCAGRANPQMVRDFAYRSGEAFDWFIDGFTDEEKQGIICLNRPVVDGYDYKKGIFTSYVGTPNFGGSVGLREAVLRSQQKAKDAGAQFIYDTKAVRLVHNEDGTVVTGVICEKDDGSGIAMAMRIGAKVEIATCDDMGSHATFPLSPLEAAETMWLNKYGKRFCNEAFGGPLLSGCAGARQPGTIFYSIWDSDWRTLLLNQIAGHLALKTWDEDSVNQIGEYMEAAVGTGAEGDDTSGKYLYCADTLEELFDYMGMEEGVKANALAEVEAWNAAREAGVDKEFGRDPNMLWPIATPPFYGFVGSKRAGGGSLVATSGLLCTGDQQVQGQGFEPIKGLYACGNTCGGRFPMGYNGIMNGVSIGMCLTLGYTLGEFLATGDLDEATTLGLNNAEPKSSANGGGGPAPM